MIVTYNPRSKNPKTGDIPTAWVGETHEERYESCEGCRLRDTDCYAWKGASCLGSISTAKRKGDKTIVHALEKSLRSARAIRLSAMGDIGGKDVDHKQLKEDIDYILENGFKILGYTHFWNRKENQWLKKYVRASCDTIKSEKQASEMGWKTVVISKMQYKARNKEIITDCEEINNKLTTTCNYYTKGLQCNNCLKCSVDFDETIVFPKIINKRL